MVPFVHPFWLRNAVYVTLVVFLESMQTWMGQPVAVCVRDIIHFSIALIYLVTTPIGILGVFAICAYEVGDTCAYFFTGHPMDTTFIDALDPMYPIRAREWGLLMFGVVPTVLVVCVVLMPFYLCQDSENRSSATPRGVLYCTFAVFLLMRGYLLVDEALGQEPRFNTDLGVRQFNNLRKYFTYPIKASFKDGAKPKNIIEIIPESFELQFLGEYNLKGYKKSMPFLSALAKNSTFFPNVHVGVKCGWSSGSIFASQCGLPLVSSPGNGNKAEILQRLASMRCIGDYLKILGYENVAIYPGDANFGGIKPILMRHGFKKFYHYVDGVRNDVHVINRLKQIIPKLANNYHTKGTPFYLFIGLEDTHPAFKVTCDVRTEYAGTDDNRCLQAFDCMDQRMESIMGMIRQQNLTPNNTVIIIHGDHPLMPTIKHYTTSVVGRSAKRKLAFILPYSEPKVIQKRVTVYDITPTLFDMLQIGCSPKFPFGSSAFSAEPGQDPTDATLAFLMRYLSI